MSSVNKTPHYNLSQFGDSPNDKPSWRGDYTGDMSKIDSQMYRNETDVTTATSTANTAKTAADNALSLAQTNKTDITEQESYFNALGINSVANATDFKNAALSKSGKILVLGDSYSDPSFSAQNWVSLFANFTGSEINNISERGAGWSQGGGTTGRNFLQIIQNTDFDDAENYRLVIIYGGYNDFRTNQPVSDSTYNAGLGLKLLRQKLPNAIIHFFFTNMGKEQVYDATFHKYIYGMYRVCKQSSACVPHGNANIWLKTPYNYEDGVHPNYAGKQIICYNIIRGITSNEDATNNTEFIESYYTLAEGVTTPSIELQQIFNFIKDGVIHLNSWSFRVNGGIAASTSHDLLTFSESPFPINRNVRILFDCGNCLCTGVIDQNTRTLSVKNPYNFSTEEVLQIIPCRIDLF